MWSNENWLDHRRLWMVAKHLQHNGFSRGYFSFLSEVQTQNIPDDGLIEEAEREWRALISASASRGSQTAASKNSQNSAKEAESNVLILGGNCTPVRNTQGHEWWPLKLLISPSYITKVFNWEGIPPAWPHTLLAWLAFSDPLLVIASPPPREQGLAVGLRAEKSLRGKVHDKRVSILARPHSGADGKWNYRSGQVMELDMIVTLGCLCSLFPPSHFLTLQDCE